MPITIVFFGGTSDLMRRSIVPAMHELVREGVIPKGSLIVGVGRRAQPDYAKSITIFGEESWKGIRVAYVQADVTANLDALKERLAELESGRHERIFYCATHHNLYGSIAKELARLHLDGKLVLEKPFGDSLNSAKLLDKHLHEHFSEEKIYRVDHYLGKDSVQNLLVLRFANPLFEHIWRNDAIAQVTITLDESIGAGERLGYYDQSGVIRDMLQNHLLQLAAFVLMDAPASMQSDALKRKKIEVLSALRVRDPSDIVIGQYEGYAKEAAVQGITQTDTPTFVAVRLFSKSRRWRGIPIVLRSGKMMQEKVSSIEIVFHKDPCMLFCDPTTQPNKLVIDIQANHGITFHMQSRGADKTVPLVLEMARSTDVASQHAYKRLIKDIVKGDKALFVHAELVYAAWRITDTILRGAKDLPLHKYAHGSQGPPLPWHIPDMPDALAQLAGIKNP